MNTVSMAINVFGGLAFFIMGMTLMSDALQKVAGERMRLFLSKVTGHPVLGLLTGVAVTGVIQSSSATTVMVVSFVNAGLLDLMQAIGVILGANIGTTITAWIVSLIGFKMNIAALALPALSIGFFGSLVSRDKKKALLDIMLGFGLLFFGLNFMKEALSTPENLEMVKGWMGWINADGPLSRLWVVAVGSLVTMVIQSSSATMAITLILAFQGVIHHETAFALILGENIGTTITANIAALGASVTARRAARSHFLFNVFGVMWVFAVWPFWVQFIDLLAPGPLTSRADLPVHMSVFHTLFNVFNALLFLPFVKQLARAATWMVPDKPASAGREEPIFEFINFRQVQVPELAILAARKDLQVMGGEIQRMLGQIDELIRNPDAPRGQVVAEISRIEERVDRMADGMVEYLVRLSQGTLSYEEAHEVAALLHTTADYERIGDHCELLMKLLRRKHEKKHEFSEEAREEILDLSRRVQEFLSFTTGSILTRRDILKTAFGHEDAINETCKILRRRNIERMSDNTCMIEGGLIFINMISSFEKIADHNVNISEEISGVR
ncbi:MAG: Na/Pi cotransporter [Deltaproteobacteria bacterium HGW-Deltaproteobacteria-22]|jgi:phosphate:Na+ symporter|nr:MAG: Na/Pi cotransporter [Deltaproteobacteria bacterium HGW-Deltaproteobacteria-22]